MYFQVRDKTSGKSVGYAYCCHGCGDRSPVRKALKLPPRWVERTELAYSSTGSHRKGAGWVINNYCFCCNSNGVNAYAVAAVARKLCRIKAIKDILTPKVKR